MKERILTSLLTVFVITGLQAQSVSPVPKLVVGLTIDFPVKGGGIHL